MDFNEFLDIIDGKYIACEDFDQRDMFMDYMRQHGIMGDSVMESDMHTPDDRWLYPRYTKGDIQIHANSSKHAIGSTNSIPFDIIAPWIIGENDNFEAPCLDGFFD